MLRSIAELAAYGALAVLLTAATLSPETRDTASPATTSDAPAAQPPQLASSASRARGALLFATKGCVGCHTHASLPNASMQVGPDLTDLGARASSRVPALDARAYVRQSLREPGAYRVAGYTALMPDLHLSDEETETLSAFLLSPAR